MELNNYYRAIKFNVVCIIIISIMCTGLFIIGNLLWRPLNQIEPDYIEFTGDNLPIVTLNDSCTILNYSYYYNTTTQQIYTTQTVEVIRPENELQQIAKDVANDYTYKANVFDCTQFCNEVKLRLEQRGYTGLKRNTVVLDCDNLDMNGYSMDTKSCKEFGGRHDILKLGDWGYLECTNGFIISPQDYGKYGLD